MFDHNAELKQLENLIRKGAFKQVYSRLRKVEWRSVDRIFALRYANVANRVDQIDLAFRILHPLVRPENRLSHPSDDEKIEFAESLRRMGLMAEAEKILSEINDERFPIVNLRLAYCMINQWRYGESIPLIRKFLATAKPDDYAHLIARVNLASALMSERKDAEAKLMLSSICEETKQTGNDLLLGNSLGLLAQLAIRQNDCDEADRVLSLAEQVLHRSQSRFSLLIAKWQAISKSIRVGQVHGDLISCRQLAQEMRDWTTLRECDLYIGHLNGDADLVQRVYYGTPIASFRNRILELVGPNYVKHEGYLWRHNSNTPISRIFNVSLGRFEDETKGLEQGLLMHRLFSILASDFYAPHGTRSLFAKLFPKENFSQIGSTARVHQIVKRLKEYFAKGGSEIKILNSEGNYKLHFKNGIALRVQLESAAQNTQQASWHQLLSYHQQQQPIGKKDVMRILRCSASTAKRLLRWAVDHDKAEEIGWGPNRKYLKAAQ